MLDPEAIDQQQQLLAAHRRTLAHYLLQQARLGVDHVPPGVTNGIAEARAEIRRIKAVLRSWGVSVYDQPDDDPNLYWLPPRNNLDSLVLPDTTPVYSRDDSALPFFPTTFDNDNSLSLQTEFSTQNVFSVTSGQDDSSDVENTYWNSQITTEPVDNSESSSDGDSLVPMGILVVIFIVVALLFGNNGSSKTCTDTICFGQTIQSKISSVDEKAEYTFTAEAGDRIIVIASRALEDPNQGSLEPKINVVPRPPSELERDCTASDPIVARANCVLTSTGTYTLTIADRHGKNTGIYRLFIQRLNNPELATPIPFDISMSGVLTATAQRVTYTFTTTDTKRLHISIERTSGDLEPRIQIFQPDGMLLPDCDYDSVDKVEADCDLSVLGKYTILISARNYGSTRGDYIVKVTRLKQRQ